MSLFTKDLSFLPRTSAFPLSLPCFFLFFIFLWNLSLSWNPRQKIHTELAYGPYVATIKKGRLNHRQCQCDHRHHDHDQGGTAIMSTWAGVSPSTSWLSRWVSSFIYSMFQIQKSHPDHLWSGANDVLLQSCCTFLLLSHCFLFKTLLFHFSFEPMHSNIKWPPILQCAMHCDGPSTNSGGCKISLFTFCKVLPFFPQCLAFFGSLCIYFRRQIYIWLIGVGKAFRIVITTA